MLISAVQTTQGTGKTNYDFIEIYNPTSEDINLKDYRLVKRTKTGATDISIKSWTSNIFIKANSYRLWASSDDPNFPESIKADDFTKSTLANDNGVALRKGEKNTGQIIDSLAWGNAQNIFIEGEIFSQNPGAGESLVRKSGQDNDNNKNDFEIILNYLPRSSEDEEDIGDSENIENTGNEKNENHPPIAEAGGNIETFINQEIEFDGSDSSDLDGDELSFSWNFGDDQIGQGANPIHSYQKVGEFKVILTTSDGSLSSTDYLIVKVSETSYSEDIIIINEIMPNPTGSDTTSLPNGEWIELYNQSSQKIDLAGWKIDDSINSGSKPHTIDSTFIEPNGYLIFYYSQTKISQNNNGDEINLINPQGKIISTCSYQEESPEGNSFSLAEDSNWYWSIEPTPGKENLIVLAENFEETINEDENENKEELGEEIDEFLESDYSEENPAEVSISEAKNLAKGTWVEVKGTVIAPPGVLSDKVFYLSDEESGIQIYFSKGDFPEINLGDFLEIIGRTSEANDEKKINIYSKDDIEILDSDLPPEPKNFKTGEIGELLEGLLVKVEGQVTSTSGNVFYLDDGSGEIKIYIRSATGIKKPTTKKGTWVTVSGIVSQTSTGYRILPRFQDDLLIGRTAGSSILPETGNDLIFILILSSGIFLMVLSQKKISKIFYPKNGK